MNSSKKQSIRRDRHKAKASKWRRTGRATHNKIGHGAGIGNKTVQLPQPGIECKYPLKSRISGISPNEKNTAGRFPVGEIFEGVTVEG